MKLAYYLIPLEHNLKMILSRKYYAKQIAIDFAEWKVFNLYKVPGYANMSQGELFDVFQSGVEL